MFKLIRSIPFHLKTAIVSIFRHFAMSFSAMSAVSVTLVMFGIMMVLAGTVQNFSKNIAEDGRIHVVLHESIASQKTLDGIEKKIKQVDHVSKIVFSSKEEELELMILERGEELAMYRGENNPLSHAFFVTVDNPHHLQEVNDLIGEINGVSATHYGGDAIAKMVDLLENIRFWGYVFVGLLSILALFLISNAIKLTIYARRNEIAIMRHVGAENWFIKTPFMLEGVLIGVFGAILPSVLVWFGYRYLYQISNGRIITSLFTLLAPDPFTTQIVALMIFFGAVVGMLGSFFVTGKYLKWKR